jgi:hypothetical protein
MKTAGIYLFASHAEAPDESPSSVFYWVETSGSRRATSASDTGSISSSTAARRIPASCAFATRLGS